MTTPIMPYALRALQTREPPLKNSASLPLTLYPMEIILILSLPLFYQAGLFRNFSSASGRVFKMNHFFYNENNEKNSHRWQFRTR